jgi:TonB family protein
MMNVGSQSDTMSAYVNILQKPERFDTCVRKLQSICAMHGVHVGSRVDLPGFMKKLVEDRHLAMDFWAFVSKVSNREGGDLSDDQLVALIVEAITNDEVWHEDGGLKKTVDDLRAMLAGVDIQTPVEIAPFPRSNSSSHRSSDLNSHRSSDLNSHRSSDPDSHRSSDPDSHRRDEPLPTPDAETIKRWESQAAFKPDTPDAVDKVADRSAASPEPPPRLDEEFLRLELTRLVKQYFEDMEKKMYRLEPHPEGDASAGIVASATTRRSLEGDEASEETLAQRARRSSRLVLEPTALFSAELQAEEMRHPPVRIPMETYPQGEAFGRPAAFMALAAVLIGAVFAAYPYRQPIEKKFAAWVSRQMRMKDTLFSPSRSGQTSAPSTPEPSPAETEQSQPQEDQSALEGASNPPPVSTPTPASTAAVSQNATSAGSQDSTVDRAPIPTESAPSDGISITDLARAVRVDAATMEANLVASRVPVYPEIAKIRGVEGNVVMQAIISRDGTVKQVHVTQGDSRLRNAAMDAVYKWQYRPYRINGHPVDVATTIIVNFNLDR